MTRRHYGLQTNAGMQRKSGYLERVCQYLIPKCMSGPARCSSFQAFPALFPASFTAITKDELSNLTKCVFSPTRHADCVCTFTFSNKVLCQHKFYVFFSTSTSLYCKAAVIFSARAPLKPLVPWERKKSPFCIHGCQRLFD